MKTLVLKSIIALGLISLTACVDSTSSSKDLDQSNSSSQVLSQVVQSSTLVSSSENQTSLASSSSKNTEQDNSSIQAQSQTTQSSIQALSSITQTSSSSSTEIIQNELALLQFQSDVHTVAGKATIQSNENNTLQIQFHSGFMIDGGPDVFIFFSDQNYEDVETGAPQGQFFKVEQQIAVQNKSTEGEMLYTIEGLSIKEATKFKSIHFYCEMFGFIHWGGASIEWK